MWRPALIFGVTAGLKVNHPELPFYFLLAVAFTLYVITGGYYTLYLMYHTLYRDLTAGKAFVQLKFRMRRARANNMCLPKMFQEIVTKNPSKVALIFQDQQWTFGRMNEYSNRIANYFAAQGLKHGDTVALCMENRPEYVCCWLGLTKIGVVPALINFNLRGTPLVHCVTVANSKAVLLGAEIQDGYNETEGLDNLPVYVAGAGSNVPTVKGGVNLDEAMKNTPMHTPPQLNDVKFSDKMVYIYTSGTTGLPKAALIKHSRALYIAIGTHLLLGMNSSDVMYNPLPLYHTAGGMLGMCQVLCFGVTAVIRKKFSASNYWSECVKYKCTVGQYIGEICRYLLNTPPNLADKQHNVRIMFGNGLRPQLWELFTERFNKPLMCELYGATEGNANIMNITGKVGAVGFVSVLAPWVYPVALVRVERGTGKLIRQSNGLCQLCRPGQIGEFVGKIIPNDPVSDFHGYADKKATQKKVASDVFKKGDMAFLSGDLLEMDKFGYLYFKDRTGDTFRWRGENVSTSEVEGVVSRIVNNKDAVVYGVEIPGSEGRAGMAAILEPSGVIDMTALFDGCKKELPAYGRPLFVRIVRELDMTGTYKLKKLDLQKQGFNPSIVKDSLFFMDASKGAYVPLDEELYKKIEAAQMRL